jgi:hypothetical protein
MDMLAYFSIKRPEVVDETIDGETVIVNLENGVYYSLRKSGVDVWNLIEAGANLEELTGLLIDRYDGSPEVVRKAISELLVALQQEGLVQTSSTTRTVSQTPQALKKGAKERFEPPLLEKYSDMQELLLLDPIHEVDEEGWPHKEEDGDHDSLGQE